MNHPYLRAYMAGIVVPAAFLLVAMTAFTLADSYSRCRCRLSA